MQSDDAGDEPDPVRYWSRRVYARACRGRVGVSREMLRATAALGSGGDLRAVAAAVYVKVAAVDTPGDRFYAEDSVCELIAIHLGTLAETADLRAAIARRTGAWMDTPRTAAAQARLAEAARLTRREAAQAGLCPAAVAAAPEWRSGARTKPASRRALRPAAPLCGARPAQSYS